MKLKGEKVSIGPQFKATAYHCEKVKTAEAWSSWPHYFDSQLAEGDTSIVVLGAFSPYTIQHPIYTIPHQMVLSTEDSSSDPN